MKTIFTYSSFRTFILTFVIAIFTLSLAGQTTHTVAVTDSKFTPQQLTIKAGDKVVWTNTGTMGHNVNGNQIKFSTNPVSFGRPQIGNNWTYEFVFTTPGIYSYQCDPHAATGMTGSVTVTPAVSTSPKLTVNFTAMTPHVGQVFWLAVSEQTTNVEIVRVKQIAAVNFSIVVPGLELDKSYNVDFWADLNRNGVYNAPPVDHAWRLPINVTGDAVLNFVHNTTFTNIAWKNKLTVHFTAMTPNLTQPFTFYLKNATSILETKVIPSVTGPVFDISSWMIEPTKTYTIDFFADFNKNGAYNPPPIDHSWRLLLTNVKSDTTINFVYNTNFFDLFIPTASRTLAGITSLRLYPNPASQYVELLIPTNYEKISSLKLYSATGKLLDEKEVIGNVESFRYDVSGLKNGVYLMEINSGTQKNTLKFLKQ